MNTNSIDTTTDIQKELEKIQTDLKKLIVDYIQNSDGLLYQWFPIQVDCFNQSRDFSHADEYFFKHFTDENFAHLLHTESKSFLNKKGLCKIIEKGFINCLMKLDEKDVTIKNIRGFVNDKNESKKILISITVQKGMVLENRRFTKLDHLCKLLHSVDDGVRSLNSDAIKDSEIENSTVQAIQKQFEEIIPHIDKHSSVFSQAWEHIKKSLCTLFGINFEKYQTKTRTYTQLDALKSNNTSFFKKAPCIDQTEITENNRLTSSLK